MLRKPSEVCMPYQECHGPCDVVRGAKPLKRNRFQVSEYGRRRCQWVTQQSPAQPHKSRNTHSSAHPTCGKEATRDTQTHRRRCSSLSSAVIPAAAMKPGSTKLMRMPRAPSSFASERVKPCNPAFEAEYTACPVFPIEPMILPMFTMHPPGPRGSGSVHPWVPSTAELASSISECCTGPKLARSNGRAASRQT